ncbi:Polyketide cyclase/dehydrase [Dillenia turbinata]|uniref:Polyketide cyclase/dehydrase n=1 Tax=Dillenia turbinata TaxID=194707 RepID=A0AAN8V5Z7_9MAGN
MGETEKAVSEWEGRAAVELTSSTADQVWPFLADFCKLHNLMHPYIDTCRQIDGFPGQPGLIRYCALTGSSSTSGGSESSIMWAHEKLLMIDAIQRCFSYEVLENNLGFKKYVATIAVSEINGGTGCEIVWSFVANPVEGWTLDQLVSYIDACLKTIAKSIEEALQVEDQPTK